MAGGVQKLFIAGIAAACIGAGVARCAFAGDGNEGPWRAALAKCSVRAWERAPETPPVVMLLSEAVFRSVARSGEPPRASELLAITDLAPFLRAIDEEPDEVKGLAALSAAENLCVEKDRPDLAGVIEMTTALRRRRAKVGQTATQRLADRLKARFPAEEADRLSQAVKSLIETGDGESGGTVAGYAAQSTDLELVSEMNAVLFACLPASSPARRQAGSFLANRTVGENGLAAWLAAHGEKKLAARLKLDLIDSIEDTTAVARLWRDLADNLAAEDLLAKRAVPFYLAAARFTEDAQMRKALHEKALSALAQAGQENAALDLLSRIAGPEISDPALKEFLAKARLRAQEELPALKERILRSPNTEVGCQALLRALRYAPVMEGDVDGLCRETVAAAPESRAAALVFLAKSEQLLRQGSPADAMALLDRLPAEKMPSDLRSQRFERLGDGLWAQGKYRTAAEAYRNAAKEYYYEYELGGFGFFGLKKRTPSAEAPVEDARIEADCLKGYLELAVGRSYEGTARLECLVVELKRLPAESEIRRLRLPDAHFLLALAWTEDGANEFGAPHGYAAIKSASREPEQRAGLFAFAQMLAARAAPEQPVTAAAPAPQAGVARGLFADAANAVQLGDYAGARAKYRETLGSIKNPDKRTVLEACEGVLTCLVKERQNEGFGAALAQFQAWAARSLPEGCDGCATLAAARVCYQRSDLEGADERIGACLTGGDEYVAMQAHVLQGLIEFRSGRMSEALPCFEQALAHAAPDEPSGADALFFVGYINMMDGKSDRARNAFDALTKRYPDSAHAAKCRDLLARLNAGDSKTAKGP